MVVGQFGATLALARVKAIALDHGLSETAEGALVRFARDGSVEFSVRRFGDDPKNPPASYTHGLTLALDVPQVSEGPEGFTSMVQLAQALASGLGGQLVDDNRRPLSDAGLASIRRTSREWPIPRERKLMSMRRNISTRPRRRHGGSEGSPRANNCCFAFERRDHRVHGSEHAGPPLRIKPTGKENEAARLPHRLQPAVAK